MECQICFCDTEPIDSLRCSDHFCNAIICKSCLTEYLKHTLKESTIPGCVGKDCQGVYLYSDVINLDKSNETNYMKSCCQSLIYKNSLVPDKSKIIQSMIAERKTYLKKEFPLAIVLVAEITCGVKLNKIRAPKTDEKKKTGRLCMNLFCDGILDDNLTCSSCNSVFCKECEKLKEKDHKCKAEDVESLKIIKDFPKCPNCGLFVDKDNACNHVKCGVCGD